MTSPNSEQLVRQRDIVPFFGLFLSVVLFGVTSVAYGYVPFSPLFCVHHSSLSMSIYALFLTSLWSYEMRFSRHSARPEVEADSHRPFWMYMGTLTILLGVLIPHFWVALGGLLSRGISLDRGVYQTMTLWVCCLLLGMIVWRARRWAHECKDISRVNRVSPARYTEAGPAILADYGEVWTPISPSLISSQLSQSMNEDYQKRRLDKLAQDTQELTVLKAIPSYGTHQPRAGSSKIRRSTGDYDTRFDAHPPEFDQYAQELERIELRDLMLYQPENDITFAPSTEEPQSRIEHSKEDIEKLEVSDTLVMPPQLCLIDELTQQLSKEDIAIWEEVNGIL
jgi:hypothetical protein